MSHATSGRSFGLDLLRAFAIVGVLIVHEVSVEHIPVLGALNSGVDLFFVLSGFLIGRIYFRSSRQPTFHLGRFWAARWWRTLPPYLAALLLYAIIRHAYSPAVAGAPLPWYYGLFLQNYLGAPNFAVTWSLCVEEHFYLALPLLALAAAAGLGRRSFRYLLPALFFVPLLLRAITLLHGLPPEWFWMTHLHCEGMIAGVWLAYLFVDEPATLARVRRIAPWVTPLLPIILFVVPVWHPGPWFDITVFTLYALGYAACLCWLHDLPWSPAGRLGRAARWSVQGLALSAYSLYLTHTLVDPSLRSFAENVLHLHRGFAKTGFVFAALLCAGALFFLLVERPSILLRNLVLRHRREQTLPASAEAAAT